MSLGLLSLVLVAVVAGFFVGSWAHRALGPGAEESAGARARPGVRATVRAAVLRRLRRLVSKG